MEHILQSKDIVLDNSRLLFFNFDSYIDGLGDNAVSVWFNENYDKNMSSFLESVRKDSLLGAELLSLQGDIYVLDDNEVLGVRYSDRNQTKVKGKNLLGKFFDNARNIYHKELQNSVIDEKPVGEGQVVVDFVPAGFRKSNIELLEADGESFVHTDMYVPVNFTFNSSKSGVTGFAQRDSDDGISFHSFVNPFGTDKKRCRIIVENEVQASFLYEKCLRNEMDYDKLFVDLKASGKTFGGLTANELDQIKNDVRSQFDWMREQVISGNLRGKRIVAESILPSDMSYGRSICDSVLAPCPAYILARYINNPVLLFKENSVNTVINALEAEDRNEQCRISTVSGDGTLTIIVDGSDTIGGRQPGYRAVKVKKDVYKRNDKGYVEKDRFGNKVISYKETEYEMPLKPDMDIEADYVAFSERIGSILQNVSPDTKVRFITGTQVGVSKMVERFVRSNAGSVYRWNYAQSEHQLGHAEEKLGKNDVVLPDSRYSVVMMPHFQEVFPVLVKASDSSSFLMDVVDDDGRKKTVKAYFSSSEMKGDNTPFNVSAMIECSVKDDVKNSDILKRGSLALSQSLPLVHVIDNMSESEQIQMLASVSEGIKADILGDVSYTHSLFEENARMDWDLEKATLMSRKVSILGNEMYIPVVASKFNYPVIVKGVSFHTIYGAYSALVLNTLDKRMDVSVFMDLSNAEGDFSKLHKTFRHLLSDRVVGDEIQERCMRNAVHIMASSNQEFSNYLVRSEGTDIVVADDMLKDLSLFVDGNGHGENRFGVVLADERENILRNREIERQKANEQAKIIAEGIAKRQRVLNTQRAHGEKMEGGFPDSIEESSDAIWFLGTSQPVELTIENGSSFDIWEQGYNGKDVLNREKASRPVLLTEDGEELENKYIFLFPTTLSRVLGRAVVKNDPNSKDLSNLRRKNPETGKEFVCAFGIPVKRNDYNNEANNLYNMPCSYRLDNESSQLVASIVAADAQARSTAIIEGMKLCFAQYNSPSGKSYDDISRVFSEYIFDVPRVKEVFDKETKEPKLVDPRDGSEVFADMEIIIGEGSMIPKKIVKKVWNSETHTNETIVEYKYEKCRLPNPHYAPQNIRMCKRYEEILDRGKFMPLNCIPMPKDDYTTESQAQFISDLTFALSIANATAIALDKPLRFPLDENGHIDLGPGVPEEFRVVAENKIDSFIGVVRKENLIDSRLPELHRVDIADMFNSAEELRSRMPFSGYEINLRPNDLLCTFGEFDFRMLASGCVCPLHEMAFVDSDGDVFRLVDPRLSKRFTESEINKVCSYENNEITRFVITSTNMDKIPAFQTALKSYIERAHGIDVEYRLHSVMDKDCDGESIEGYVHLFSSNSENLPVDEHDLVARSSDALTLGNKFDGTDNDSVYYGKEDARDGFEGYVQFRYTLPDGMKSGWVTLKNDELEFAKDVVLSSVMRTYRSDTRIVPSKSVIINIFKSLAVKNAGPLFLNLNMPVKNIVEDDKVVHSQKKASVQQDSDLKPAVVEKTMNIYAGANENAELSNFALRPFDYDVKKFQVKF